jgi:DNA repair photolyase
MNNKLISIINNDALISKNNFEFKSLSDWSYNISIGCLHGCSFCYVPQTSTIKQETLLERHPGLIPESWIAERKAGKHWGDHHWGDYALLRTWDEKKFRASLRKAQSAKDIGALSPDGNAAIMFCTTTDPYQTLNIPGNPEMTRLMQDRRKGLVRRALEIILNNSDLNVRILTRSPLAEQDFDLYQQFGTRLLFGMSIPTLDDSLSQIYEPNAPGPQAKMRTLERAVAAGIHVYVAMAPTLPDEGEAALRKTMETLAAFNPVTIFHEPINLRAENVARIEAKARELGKTINSAVFQSRESWREYAYTQFALVDKIAQEMNLADGVLHQWPDKTLASKPGFMRMKAMQAERDLGSSFTTQLRKAASDEWDNSVSHWLQYWHKPKERISSWPSGDSRQNHQNNQPAPKR